MKEIPLTQGKVAFVDDADYDWLNQWKWCAHRDHDIFYAMRAFRMPKGRKMLQMHRLIIHASDGEAVDHIDRNGLNNQRSNLRIATVPQNAMNRKRPSTNKSGFKGVSWSRTARKWHARICVNGINEHLGYHTSAEAAHAAYIAAAKEYFGEFARTS